MYETYYGLREQPFDLSPNPRYLVLTDRHQEVLTHLRHGISQRVGVTVVIGPPGTGKTTLIRAAMAEYSGADVHCLLLTNPLMKRDEFLQAIARGFDLSEDASQSKAVLLEELDRCLRARTERNVLTALIVDEAQSMSAELLEEVRLLMNLETDTHKLFSLILAGQSELSGRLNEPSALALKQRIALRCELMPLRAQETAQYIASRVRIAGGVPSNLFTAEAVTLIHERSGGIPRVVNVLCANSLLSGFASAQRPVRRDIVLEVCRDFDFPEIATPEPASASPVVEETPQPIAVADEAPSDASTAASAAVDRFRVLAPQPSARSWFSR
jgi:general secretion pathway protein A